MASLSDRRVDFSKFLESTKSAESAHQIALNLCRLLQQECSCERIIFLSRRPDYFQVVYSHGPGSPEDHQFRIPYTAKLAERLSRWTRPAPLETLKEYLPDNLYQRLHRWQCDQFFAIPAGTDLYGLYFIMSTTETRSESFDLLISSVAHLPAIVRHSASSGVASPERLQTAQKSETPVVQAAGQELSTSGVFKLIRHRSTKTLVGKIIDEVQKDLQLDRYAFLCESGQDAPSLRTIKSGIKYDIDPPQRSSFNDLLARLEVNGLKAVTELERYGESAAEWGEKLQYAGLEYMASFPLSADRSGVLLWADEKSPEEILSRLEKHRVPVTHLMENAESFERIEELSHTDNLTGLANQRYFLKRFDEEIDRAKRYRRSLALIIIDVDELKAINDRYGHQAGDSVIQRMGELLSGSIRSNDVIARYGGDEFCVIMPESDRATCRKFMNRLQQRIAGSTFNIKQLETDRCCTISQGAAVYPDHGSNSEQLIFAADMALLKAKESGRNQYLLT
jgi:diguanylate cyclase (GGDEF)-like protein